MVDLGNLNFKLEGKVENLVDGIIEFLLGLGLVVLRIFRVGA